MFDLDNDNILSPSEMSLMAAGLLQIYIQYEDTSDMDDLSVDLVISDIKERFKKHEITYEDFRSWASTSTLIHEYLLLLSQICHIIFGLKPSSQEEEGFIIRRWLDRENKNGLQVGRLYYLIAVNWWKHWQQYVHFESCGMKSNGIDNTGSSHVNAQVNGGHQIRKESTENKSGKQAQHLKRSNQVHTELENGITIRGTVKPPGLIDNNVLLAPQDAKKLIVLTGEGGRLRSNINKKEYVVLPEPIWKALFSWYGGTVALPRTVIRERGNTNASIELFPLQIFIYKHTIPPKSTGFSLNSFGINNLMSQFFGSAHNNTGNQQEQHPVVLTPKRTLTYRASFSQKNTIRQIIDYIGQRLKINPEDLRLWRFENENDLQLIEEEERMIENLQIEEGSSLLLEIRNRDLSWPEEMNTLVATRVFRERSNTGLLEHGATGLHNLGNTCFMNSAIQCLSNTKPLTQYFRAKVFSYELNKTNPLGMKGILAKRYGDLILDLWSGFYRSIAPVKLRWTIGRYAPRFNGFQQHDSQELLSFLLDGLHEDVNRVHDKPYVELKDSDGRPDDEVANEAWENHVKRNRSIIIDLFQGQLKSQVRCLHCNNVSVRFDPFTFLSLPLPMESSLHMEIPLFLLEGGKARKYGVLLEQEATVKMLKKALSELSNIPVENLMLVEVVGPTIKSFLSDTHKVRSSLIGYIYGYEIEIMSNTSPTTNQNSQNTSTSSSSISPNLDGTINSSLFTNISNTSDLDSTMRNANSSSSLNNVNGPLPTNKQNTASGSHTLPKNKNKTLSKTLKSKMNILNSSKSQPVKVVEVTSKNLVSVNVVTKNSTSEVTGILSTSVPSNHSSVDTTASLVECHNDETTFGLIIAMNRKMMESPNYFLSWQKFRPALFGLPILISCQTGTTNRELYEYVWRHISKYLTCAELNNKKKYPFEIKTVDRDGHYCVWCPWYRFCRGCPIPCDDDCFGYASSHLAIDWDSTTLHLHYQHTLEKDFVEHESVENSQKRLREPISLDQCLRDFTKEEELGEDETWYCSKCKEHRTIAKKFDIWKLPPILVVHIKRFQLLNTRWVKSNKLVKFPSKDFDPSVYLVKKQEKLKSRTQSSVTDPSQDAISSDNEQLENADQREQCELEDFSESTEDTDPVDFLYDLYALSCHSGILNGGHYIAYAKNPNGKWYCYNDSSCKEIEPNLIENETPYMLFYEKKHLNTIEYLPDIKGKDPVGVQQEEDEFDKEVKKYCVIM